MFEWLKPKIAGWKAPEADGPSMTVKLLSPADRPIAGSARWIGEELEIVSNEAAIKSLFDVPLPQLEQCRIDYAFLIRTEALQSAVYPMMWCRVPEMGQFFSKGIDRKLTGTHDWTPVEISFYLEQRQVADLLQLNLAFEGPGQVWLKQITVLSTPVRWV